MRAQLRRFRRSFLWRAIRLPVRLTASRQHWSSHRRWRVWLDHWKGTEIRPIRHAIKWNTGLSGGLGMKNDLVKLVGRTEPGWRITGLVSACQSLTLTSPTGDPLTRPASGGYRPAPVLVFSGGFQSGDWPDQTNPHPKRRRDQTQTVGS